MNLCFQILSLRLLIFSMNDQEFWIMLFHVFFCSIIKINHFVNRFFILLRLISPLSLNRSFLAPYAYVSIESIDFILSSSFELKAILLISFVKTFCFALLNICCLFDINILFLMDSLCFLL